MWKEYYIEEIAKKVNHFTFIDLEDFLEYLSQTTLNDIEKIIKRNRWEE